MDPTSPAYRPTPRAQPVHTDALAAALARLNIKVDAAELLAVVREQEQLLRPCPPPESSFNPRRSRRERLKDPLVQAARKRILDNARAAFFGAGTAAPSNRYDYFRKTTDDWLVPGSITAYRMSYSSAKATAEKLARHLADPRDPTLCPLCLGASTRTLCQDFIEHFPRLRIECHPLFDACIATLTLRRTPDEVTQLQRKLISNLQCCRKHRGPDDLYQPLSAPVYLRSVLENAGYVFTTAVEQGERSFAARAEKNKAFADKRGRWPVHVEQLFPDGVHAAVDALLGYCELYISAAPIGVIRGMLIAARSAILPVLLADAFRPRVVDVALKMLDPVASGIAANAPWLLENRLAFNEIRLFVGILMIGPGGLPRDVTELFAGYEPELLRVLGPVTENLAHDDTLFPSLAGWCAGVAKRQNMPLPPRVARWVESSLAHPDRNRPPAHFVYQLVLLLTGSRICSGPACTLSSLQTEDAKPFPACARCRVPRYCSRACQRRDWKGDGGAPVPHKRVCSVLGKLGAHACPALTRDQFADAYARAEPLLDATDRAAIATFISAMAPLMAPDPAATN
ncbi:hypothetical protein AURDEDRAFT_128228 [Auricularia subglabra TFB-10046 SS5]|nr:hypothetical protein AURDEDRAFT_128228 [Auricularia subglabra TFB-10046 SS5]